MPLTHPVGTDRLLGRSFAKRLRVSTTARTQQISFHPPSFTSKICLRRTFRFGRNISMTAARSQSHQPPPHLTSRSQFQRCSNAQRSPRISCTQTEAVASALASLETLCAKAKPSCEWSSCECALSFCDNAGVVQVLLKNNLITNT